MPTRPLVGFYSDSNPNFAILLKQFKILVLSTDVNPHRKAAQLIELIQKKSAVALEQNVYQFRSNIYNKFLFFLTGCFNDLPASDFVIDVEFSCISTLLKKYRQDGQMLAKFFGYKNANGETFLSSIIKSKKKYLKDLLPYLPDALLRESWITARADTSSELFLQLTLALPPDVFKMFLTKIGDRYIDHITQIIFSDIPLYRHFFDTLFTYDNISTENIKEFFLRLNSKAMFKYLKNMPEPEYLSASFRKALTSLAAHRYFWVKRYPYNQPITFEKFYVLSHFFYMALTEKNFFIHSLIAHIQNDISWQDIDEKINFLNHLLALLLITDNLPSSRNNGLGQLFTFNIFSLYDIQSADGSGKLPILLILSELNKYLFIITKLNEHLPQDLQTIVFSYLDPSPPCPSFQ